jgi:hypothetical protein
VRRLGAALLTAVSPGAASSEFHSWSEGVSCAERVRTAAAKQSLGTESGRKLPHSKALRANAKTSERSQNVVENKGSEFFQLEGP